MDFFSKFKKTDDQAKQTSDDQEPDSSSYATDNYSSGDFTKGADDATESYSDKPSGGEDAALGKYTTGEYDQSGGEYGEDGYSKKPSYTTGTDHEGGYVEDTEKPSETDVYQKPEAAGGYGEDTEEISFSKKPSYGDETAVTDDYEKPQGFPYGKEATQEKTDNYGNYTSTEEGADSAEAYDADATQSYRKKQSGATTVDYASDGKYNE